jgi:tetratricopeptide (TPR) repeat protein
MNLTRTDGSTEYDLFISYHRADKEKVMPVYRALRNEGLRVWIDETDVSDYTSITRSIVDGLSRSKALLAYYSHTYPQRRACQWELTAAFLASGQEADPTCRILVINPEEGVEHIHPVELRDAKFRKMPKDASSDDISKIAASVKAHVTDLKGLIGDIHAFKSPTWYGARKGFGSNRFVGRLSYMWKIHSALTGSGFSLIADAKAASSVAQVHGMGGVGKSLLALEYALRYRAAFPGGIFWLSAFGNDDAKEGMGAKDREAERSGQISRIAEALGIPVQERSPEEIEGDLKRELEQRGEPFLWVVDDLPAGMDMDMDTLERWLAPHPLGMTLITTRTREYDSLGTPIPLDVLEPDEAYELLTSQRRPKDTEEADAARKLLKDLGYHALAVDVAGAALQTSLSSTAFTDFINKLVNPTKDALEFASELTGTLPTGHETSIASTFLRSIEKMGPEGQDFLRLASRLAVAPIPASLAISVFREADGLSEESGEDRATLAIHSAEKFSLAERVEGGDVAFLVHTLVSRTMRFQDIGPKRSGEFRDAAVRVLTDEFRENADDPRTHHELDLVVVHARELVSRDEEIATVDLMGWVAQYDHVRGVYKSAENLYHLQWEIRNRILGDEHPGTLASMNNLAETLRAQGDLTGAREKQEEVLEITRRILGDEHPGTLASMNNLALTLSDQGDLTGAREKQEEVLEKRRRILGDEHPNTLTSMNNLALTLRAQGDLTGAREKQEEVLEITRCILGDEHPDTLRSMNNLALTLSDQGDLTGAREKQEEVLEITRRILGDEHPNTLISIANLAGTLRAQGDLAGAREKQEEVLKIRRRILGVEHHDTSLSAWNLFSALREMGDSIGARTVLETDLCWLLDRDPATLGAYQQQIREMIIQLIRDRTEAEI